MKSNNILNGGVTPINSQKKNYNTSAVKPKFVYPAEKLKEFKAKKHG